MERIAELRREKHLTQTGLGLRLNVSQKMISAYENGLHQPSIETLIEMSKIFNVSVDYIIGNSDIKLTSEQLAKTGLNSNEIELLNLFRELSVEKQLKAIGIIFALNNI